MKVSNPCTSYIDNYIIAIDRYREYTQAEENDWRFSENIRESYSIYDTIARTTIDRLVPFVKDFKEQYGSRKYYKDFIGKCKDVINTFLLTSREYIRDNDWLTIIDPSEKTEAIEFNSEITKNIARIRTKFESLNLDGLTVTLDLPIRSNEKIPLMMMDRCVELFPRIEDFKQNLIQQSLAPSLTPHDVLSSTEFYLNCKNPPEYNPNLHFFEQPISTQQFYEAEYEKMISGINLSGVHISGWLYFHTNFFKTEMPMSQFKGTKLYNSRKKVLVANPKLRDNEWYLSQLLIKAKEEERGIIFFGTRRFGKALRNDEVLHRVNGEPYPIGDAKIGDVILDGEGKPTNINGVFPQGSIPIYDIKINEDIIIHACRFHIWEVKVVDNITDPYVIQMNTGDILSLYLENDIYIPQWVEGQRIWHKVNSIIKSEESEATCIEVDSPNSLFLTTHNIITHNTVTQSSYLQYIATTVANSECEVLGGSAPDLAKLTKAIETSMNHMHPAFKFPTQKRDWKKKVELGLKYRNNTAITHGTINIKNAYDGQKDSGEKGAGASPDAFIVDEIGKFEVKELYLSAEASFMTPDGLRCTPLLFGCLTAGNKVWTKEGKYVNIEDLTQKEGITGYSGESQLPEDINWFKPPAKKECIRIECEANNEIGCSTDHPLLVVTKKNNRKTCAFKKAEDIKVGDSLLMLDTVGMFGKYDEPDAYLFGLMIGDGNISKSCGASLAINSKDEGILEFIGETQNYRIKRIKKTVTNPEGCYDISINGKIDSFKNADLWGRTRQNKRLPKQHNDYDKKSLSELIAGYYDADGNIGVTKSKYVRVVLTSMVRPLLEQVKFSLLKFGIHSNIIKENRKDKGYGNSTHIYRLYLRTYTDVLRFQKNIPLKCKHKSKRLNSVLDISPKSIVGFGDYDFKFNEDFPKGEYFKGMVFREMRKVIVKKVTDLGEQEIYNLNTSTTHSYISNGFISANTGGDAGLSMDAKEMLANPKAFNLLEMDYDLLEKYIPDPEDITWTQKKFGCFAPAQLSYYKGLVKDKTTLSDYLKVDDEELRKVEIEITDWKKAKEILLAGRKEKEGDEDASLKLKKYYPLDTTECFLGGIGTPFTCGLEGRLHLEELMRTEGVGNVVDLYRSDTGKWKWKPSKKPIAKYPHKALNIDAGMTMFIPPPEEAKIDSTFVAGLDHYKHDKSGTDSIGSLIVYKRMVSLSEDCDTIAMSYHARPDTMKQFNANCYKILQAYGAVCLQENADVDFQKYLAAKNVDMLYLASGDMLAQTMIKATGSMQNNKYGLNPTARNKSYIIKLVVDYCNEEIEIGEDEIGNKITVKGIVRIKDINLLREILAYEAGGNYDRITSFGHALAWNRYLNEINVLPPSKKKEDLASDKKRRELNRERRKNPYRFGHGSERVSRKNRNSPRNRRDRVM